MLHNQNLKIMQNLKSTLLLVAALLFATSCHDYFEGPSSSVDLEQSKKGPGEGDDDSDRPPWAGGNTNDNPHIKGNDDSGTTRGGDYGDLYVLDRDEIGKPNMTWVDLDLNNLESDDEFFVQPVDINGLPLDLDGEGGLVDPTKAIPVDFGRLNIVRSPQSVIDQALREALKVINAGDEFTLDFCGRLSIWNNGILTKTIDSPRENMAMYQELMNNAFGGQLGALASSGIDPYLLASSCFAAGSDKTGTINIDEVVYVNGFKDCLGDNPVLNEHEYDFNNEPKYYWDFGTCDGTGGPFTYTRDIFKDRMIQFLVWDNEYFPVDENGNSDGPDFSIYDIFEGGVVYKGPGERPEFTYRWSEHDHDFVEGFTLAADDAVQVLDFVHGDSNIRFLP